MTDLPLSGPEKVPAWFFRSVHQYPERVHQAPRGAHFGLKPGLKMPFVVGRLIADSEADEIGWSSQLGLTPVWPVLFR